jgi:tetratricopeptide (TPR) repeat protein
VNALRFVDGWSVKTFDQRMGFVHDLLHPVDAFWVPIAKSKADEAAARAEMLAASKEYAQAADEYGWALWYSEDVKFFLGRAKVYREYKKLDKSLLDFQAAATMKRSSVALAGIGDVAYELQKWSVAEEAYRDLIRLDRNNPAGYDGRARALARLGRFGEAMESAKIALAFDPKSQQFNETKDFIVSEQASLVPSNSGTEAPADSHAKVAQAQNLPQLTQPQVTAEATPPTQITPLPPENNNASRQPPADMTPPPKAQLVSDGLPTARFCYPQSFLEPFKGKTVGWFFEQYSVALHKAGYDNIAYFPHAGGVVAMLPLERENEGHPVMDARFDDLSRHPPTFAEAFHAWLAARNMTVRYFAIVLTSSHERADALPDRFEILRSLYGRGALRLPADLGWPKIKGTESLCVNIYEYDIPMAGGPVLIKFGETPAIDHLLRSGIPTGFDSDLGQHRKRAR